MCCQIFGSRYSEKVLIESHSIELIWTVSPIFILFFMAYPSLFILYYAESLEGLEKNFFIKIIGHQWYWEYEIGLNGSYEDNLAFPAEIFYTLETTRNLDLPVKTLISLFVTSQDVLHAWTIPRIGVKVDAIPGRINSLILFSVSPGIYFGQCREICGANHRFMPIMIKFI